MISLGGASLTYETKNGSSTVLQDIDLDILGGERIAILGLSGSGKSSLLRLISGETGLISKMDGKRAVRNSLVFHAISQNPFESFHPMKKLGWHLKEALRTAPPGRTTSQTEIDEIGQSLFSDFDSILRKYPDEVSGGELMRFSICIGILRKPDVLLADEPTGSLDSMTASEVADMLASAADRTGAALVVATHDLSISSQICKSAIVLEQGKVQFRGPISEAIGHYRVSWGSNDSLQFDPSTGPAKPLVMLSESTLTRRGDDFALKVHRLSIEAGSRIALTGRSGSGKSTLIKCLFDTSIRVTGNAKFEVGVRGPRKARSKLGLVFQDTWSTLNPNHKVKQILTEALLMAGRREPDPKLVEMLEQTGLSAEHLHRRPTELSGGQRQRVAVLRALLQGPYLLAMDEPTSHLDPVNSNQTWRLVADLLDPSCALLVATHDPNEIRNIAREILNINQGRLTAGEPSQPGES